MLEGRTAEADKAMTRHRSHLLYVRLSESARITSSQPLVVLHGLLKQIFGDVLINQTRRLRLTFLLLLASKSSTFTVKDEARLRLIETLVVTRASTDSGVSGS